MLRVASAFEHGIESFKLSGTIGDYLVQLQLKADSIRSGSKDLVQASSEYLQAWRFHSLSWAPVPASDHPHGE